MGNEYSLPGRKQKNPSVSSCLFSFLIKGKPLQIYDEYHIPFMVAVLIDSKQKKEEDEKTEF